MKFQGNKAIEIEFSPEALALWRKLMMNNRSNEELATSIQENLIQDLEAALEEKGKKKPHGLNVCVKIVERGRSHFNFGPTWGRKITTVLEPAEEEEDVPESFRNRKRDMRKFSEAIQKLD